MSASHHILYNVPFDAKNSRHIVGVCFHRTRAGMRCLLTKRGHEDSSNTLACCWQPHKFDGKLVAEIHLPVEGLRVGNIIHESVHAAMQRCKLIGSMDSDWNEEGIALDTERLACRILNLWRTVKKVTRHRNTTHRKTVP